MTTKKSAVAVAASAAAPTNPLDAFSTDGALIKKGHLTLSARIRALQAEGATTGQISRIVKRSNGEHPLYQHVRNVLNTPLKGTNDVVAVAPPVTPTKTA